MERRTSCPPVRMIDPPRTRDALGNLLRDNGFHGIGVEVGVQRGRFMRTVLEGWQHAALYVQVDLWEHQEQHQDLANVNAQKQLDNMNSSCQEAIEAKQHRLVDEVVQCKDLRSSRMAQWSLFTLTHAMTGKGSSRTCKPSGPNLSWEVYWLGTITCSSMRLVMPSIGM